MRLSVIVTTYNQPEWLDLVLRGYAAQTFRDFELVIADDGSDERTAAVIEQASARMRVPILHIWHEDHGFRKCRILNRAILAASGDILIFTDGDCIPRNDLLAVCNGLMRPGRFLSGGYAKLTEQASHAISAADVEAGFATDYRWLLKHGSKPHRALRRLLVPAAAGRVLDALTPTRASFNGHNAAVWRRDALAINGFDERMGWGGLDREFGERLVNAGIHGLQVRHRAHVVHLDHPRGYMKAEVIRANRAIRDETARTKRIRTPHGLDRTDSGMVHDSEPGRSGTVLVFRKHLLPWSETFVAAQGRAVRRYKPVFVGYQADQGGIGYISGNERVLLSRRRDVRVLRKTFLKLTGHMPRRFLYKLARQQPRLVHAHFGTSIMPAAAIATGLDIPLVVTFHGHDIATTPASREAAEHRARALARVDHAIAVSEFIGERLRAAGCPPDRITVHRIGVDTDTFSPAPTTGHTAQVLFVGRLVKKKGLEYLLRAFPAIVERVPAASLLVVGDGPLRGELESLAHALGVNATFIGIQSPEQVRNHMRAAAVLAAPGISTERGDAEGLPMTIIEALACGLPVVAATSGGTAEGVRDRETGFLVQPGDEAMLAARVGDLLASEAMRADMRLAARSFALETFSLDRQTALLEQIYDRVVEEYAARLDLTA